MIYITGKWGAIPAPFLYFFIHFHPKIAYFISKRYQKCLYLCKKPILSTARLKTGGNIEGIVMYIVYIPIVGQGESSCPRPFVEVKNAEYRNVPYDKQILF